MSLFVFLVLLSFFAFSAVSRRRLFSSPAIGFPFSVRLPASILFSIPRGLPLKTISKRQRQKNAEADHSLFRFFLFNRSSAKWLQVFADAGLKVIKEVTQEGMPEELFVVKA